MFQDRYNTLLQNHHQQKGRVALLRDNIDNISKQLTGVDNTLAIENEVLRLLQMTSAATWDTTKQLVENLVTRALRAVFHDRDYKFLLKQEIKRGAASVSFLVVDNGLELDLVDELGGGISDVVSLVLRIALLTLHQPKLRQLLILDEPLKHLWSGYQPNAADFLRSVCKELDITMLVVTHQKELSIGADQVFQVRNIDGICQVTEEPA